MTGTSQLRVTSVATKLQEPLNSAPTSERRVYIHELHLGALAFI